MKAAKIILSIFGIGFMLLMALVSFVMPAYLSAALFLVLAFWISPLSKSLKESFVDTTGRKIVSIVLCVIVFVTAFGFIPSNGSAQNSVADTVENEVSDADNTIEERSIPEELNSSESSTVSVNTASDDTSTNISNTDNGYDIVVADSTGNNAESVESTSEVSQNSDIQVAESQNEVSQNNTNTQQSVDNSVPQNVDTPVAPTQDTTNTQQSTVNPPQTVDESSNQSSSGGNANNFTLYNNPEQQQTTETWVLNTNTMKIHYPGCSSVANIKPENYAVSSQSLQELMAMGYDPCGRCFK